MHLNFMSKDSLNSLCRRAALALSLLLCALPLPQARAAAIPEPATVLYGRIIAAGRAPFVVTEGQLEWSIRRPDGTNIALRTSIRPVNGGEFSYRLDVPHQVLAAGLNVANGVLPLRVLDETSTHYRILVNGLPARIIGPGRNAFEIAQTRRAATYQLDLEVGLEAIDSDGNGLPDWWETKYGLTDPYGDPDGDGRNNLAEFRAGSNPRQDDRSPTLETRVVTVYGDGTTGLRLRVHDSDSTAANIRYAIRTLPQNGALHLRTGPTGAAGSAPLALKVSDFFTQADVEASRLVFRHSGGTEKVSSFEVELRDENPLHPPTNSVVTLRIYRPDSTVSLAAIGSALELPYAVSGAIPIEEQQHEDNYRIGRDLKNTVWDLAGSAFPERLSVPSASLNTSQYEVLLASGVGRDSRHLIVGGLAADELIGGMEDDILVGGRGDDRLRGNGGRDLFVFRSATDGNDVIEDFNVAEQDALDFSRLLEGTSTSLTDYIRITPSGADTLVGIDANGDGSGFTDVTIRLLNRGFTAASLYELVEDGSIITPGKWLPARVTIAATLPTASENGPTAGQMRVTRTGATNLPLTVALAISGSAANGVDYQTVPNQVTIAAGQRSANIAVQPYVDALTEGPEFAEIIVQPGTNYQVGTPNTARVTIEDLAALVSIEPLEPLALKNGQVPGYFLITRSGIIDRSLLVRLTLGGTATSGVDYDSISTFINLAPNQTVALVQVTPKSTAILNGGAEYVELTIKADAAYRIGGPAAARVVIAEEMLTFGQWRSRAFPQSTGTLTAFAADDPGQHGVPNLLRYAFGLDPANPERARMPRASIREGRLQIDFFRRPDASDLEYVVEVSSDLVTWDASSTRVEAVSPATGLNDPSAVCYRATQPVTGQAKQFLRVRVIQRP